MNYTPLLETASMDNLTDNNHSNDMCRSCKSKLSKKQTIDHTPIQCLSQRFEYLENEIIRLRDHDMKSRLHIKELENQIVTLQDAVKGITAEKQREATPYSILEGHKLHLRVKKSHSEDLPAHQPDINYDNIIRPPRSNSRERVGLFGSLGASSQQH
ncbi:hypothetical protein I4U23_027779 [Adineta vaga]|nr:hypothetical protein I4U23_027779 [Adineta vaga]